MQDAYELLHISRQSLSFKAGKIKMADEVEKLEAKLVQKISFTYTSPFPGALSWSCDDRISVVTDQCIYVITLLFSEEVLKSSCLKYHLSCVPVNRECFEIKTGDINNYDLSKAACSNLVKRLLDPIANPSRTSGVNLTSYRSVAWSPTGCDSYGRSIIATLCFDHRLSLYTTNKIDKDWKELFCISDIWHDKCRAILELNPKYKKFKERKGYVQSKMPVEMISKSELQLDYIDQVAFTCLDWCPVLLGSQDERYTLLTAVTKSGKITFWKVEITCLAECVSDVKLIESNIQTDVPLPCSVAWCSKNGLEGLVAVGGSNGQIEVMNLKVSQDSECNLSISMSSKHILWADCDDFPVDRLQWTPYRRDQSSFATLSASKGSAIVQFSVPLSDKTGLDKSEHQIHDGIHSSFVTGLDVSPDGRVFTCDSDGILQMIDESAKMITYGHCNPSLTCNGIAVSPNGLYIALVHAPNRTRLQVDKTRSHPVEVSILSIFSETFLSELINHSSFGSLWDVQMAICQHYSQSGPPKKGPLVEFLNLSLDTIPLLSLYVRHRLVGLFAKNTDSDCFTAEDVGEDLITGQQWKLENIMTGRKIVKQLLVSSLTLWLQDYKQCNLTEKALMSLLIMSDWLVMNDSHQDSLDLAVQVYNTTGNIESATLAPSIREERSRGNNHGLMDPLKQERMDDEDSSVINLTQNTGRESSNELPSREKCKICQKDIPLTNLTSGQCANGHTWKRCLVTFCACADYLYNRCQDCGGCISLIGQEQSPWLQRLFRETDVCSLCHGWKDSRV